MPHIFKTIFQFALCVILVGQVNLSAQQVITRPGIQLIAASDGYPFSETTALMQDNDGFIWIASIDGLSRYDGYSFVSITKELSLTRSVISMTEGTGSDIWLGHFEGKVTRIDRKTMSVQTFQCVKDKEADVSELYKDSKGRIWASLRNAGLFLFNGKDSFERIKGFDPEQIPTESYPGLLNNNVVAMAELSDTLWLGTTYGLYRMNILTKHVEPVSRMITEEGFDVAIQTMVKVNATLWMGTYGHGVVEFNTRNNQWKSFRYQIGEPGTSNIVNDIEIKDVDELWLATSGKGIGTFSLRDHQFKFYSEPDVFDSGPLCHTILFDKNRIIWSTSDRGLFKWNAQAEKFTFTKIVPLRSDNGVYYGVSDVLQTKTRTIIGTMFTYGLFLHHTDGRSEAIPFDIVPKAEPFRITSDIHQDSQGKIWVLTRDFLYHLTETNDLVKDENLNRTLPSTTVPYFVRMLESKNGDLYVASSREGFFIRKKHEKNWSRLTRAKRQLLSDRVLRMTQDGAGNIWMLHPFAGLTRYNPTADSSTFFPNAGDSLLFASNRLSDIATDNDGKIWVSTFDGISIIDAETGKIKPFALNESLPSGFMQSLCVDSYGNMWMAGSQGLSVFTRSGLLRNFNHLDGLVGIATSFILGRGGDGQMHIFTYQGYYTFDPQDVLGQEQLSNAPAISVVRKQSQSIWDYGTRDPIIVPYNENTLSFEFTALNFANPQRNQYQFKMDGLEREWTTSTQHRINYSGLPSGEFTFLVKLENQPDELATPVKILVTTPFWRTTWFNVMMIIVIAGGLYAGYYVRTKHIRTEEQAKLALQQKLADVEMKALRAQMSPHFIFNSLNSINRYIVKSDPETASTYLTKFSKLMRLILENSNHKVITLEQELNALKLYIELESMRFNHRFTYAFDIDKNVDPSIVGIPPMIIQPFIENAIWHGLLHKDGPGCLTLKVQRVGESLQCIIEDNGVGRRKARELKSKSINSNRSFGMKITSDRLSMSNGNTTMSTVGVEDVMDEHGNALGTKVILHIAVVELEPEF